MISEHNEKIDDIITNINDEENLILNEELNENIFENQILNKSISDDSDLIESESDTTKDEFNVLYQFHTNKHKREGKHSLKRDIIFNGKKDEKTVSDAPDTHQSTASYKLESGSIFEFESKNNEEYVNQKQLSKDVFDVLSKNTNIDFNTNRRKPNKITFNEYYILLLNNLRMNYTNSELFVELAYYFTDNIFNMFKLLDKRHATIIIKELKQKGYLKDLDNINFI